MAECDRCDVYFGFDPNEVYTLPQRLSPTSGLHKGLASEQTEPESLVATFHSL